MPRTVPNPRKKSAAKRSPRKQSAPVRTLAVAARRHPMVAEIERQLERCGLPGDGTGEQKLVVGVSGGADSIALLLGCLVIAQRAQPRNKAKLVPVAVHVHHHLRDSADEDAKWVETLCKKLGVAHQCCHVKPGDLKGNVSANARMLRYEALAHAARDVGAQHVAVAHHSEDQFETILIALCRGAGLDGLSGMSWSRPLWLGVSLIRPLLGVLKSDCEDLCKRADVEWREDPTNVDPRRVRARLRRDVLPVLCELWPDVQLRATGIADAVCAAKAALERELQDAFGSPSRREWQRATIAEFGAAIVAAGLRRAALYEAPEISDALHQRHLIQGAEAVVSPERKPRQFDWPGGLVLRVTAKTVALGDAPGRVNRRSD